MNIKKLEWVNVERVNRLYFSFPRVKDKYKKKQFGGHEKLIWILLIILITLNFTYYMMNIAYLLTYIRRP